LLYDIALEDEIIYDFYKKLRSKINNKWQLMTELENLELANNLVFILMGCRIKTIDSKDMKIDLKIPRPLHISGIKNDFLDISKQESVPIKTDPNEEFYYPLEISDCIGKVGIYTEVVAGSSDKAKELALINFKIALGLLNLFLPYVSLHIKKREFKYPTKLYTMDQNMNYGFHSLYDENQPTIRDLTIKEYNYLDENGVYNLDPESSIGRRVNECLYWYRNARVEREPASRLIHYVTILEAVLKTPGDKSESTLKLKDRCALLLGDNLEKRKKIAIDVSKIYDIRSNIVHTGKMDINENYVKLAEKYVRNSLMELIRYNHKNSCDFDTFIEMLDNKKYS
jgi:hypothetical protein